MTEIEKILKYQDEDGKLIKIEHEVASSNERKNLMQAINFVTKASERLDALEQKAVSLNSAFQDLKKSYEETFEVLAEFDNLDEMLEDGADISFYKKNISQITDKLKSLRAEISSLSKTIKESDEEFQNLYQKRRVMQKQGKEYQEAYEKYRETKKIESERIKAGLEELSKSISPEIFKKYQIKRSEHIFPVLCSVNGDRCSKCGYELSLVGKEKISSSGFVECENCHRVLYKEK